MTFKGRGFPKPLIIRTSTESGVTIRVDDAERPESWAELFLSRADLEAALRMVDCIRDASAPEDEDTVLAPPEPVELAEVDGVPGAIVPTHDLGEKGGA